MNMIYRSIYNEAIGAWVAISEIDSTKGKRSGSSKSTIGTKSLGLKLLASALMMVGLGMAPSNASTEIHFYSVNSSDGSAGNYDNDGATGLNALAAGVNVRAVGNDSIAIGSGAVAAANTGFPLPTSDTTWTNGATPGEYAVAIGHNAKALGDHTIAIGSDAGKGALGSRNLLIGDAAGLDTETSNNILLGQGAGRMLKHE